MADERKWNTTVLSVEEERARLEEDVREAAEKKLKRAEKYLAVYERVERAVRPHLGRLVRCSYGSPVEVNVGTGQVNGILVKLHNCESFRRVTPLLRDLAKEDFHLKGEPSDYAEIGRRIWELSGDADGTTLVQVMAFVPTDGADGAVCRVVETEEYTTVRRIVCPDDEGAEAADAVEVAEAVAP